MTPAPGRLAARELVREWAARERYLFSTAEVEQELGVSDAAARAALRRLKTKGEIATPYRGIHKAGGLRVSRVGKPKRPAAIR